MNARKIILMLIVTILSLTGAANAAQILTVTPETHDFGDITEGVMASIDFIIKNTGDATLNIGRVKTSCGCTTSELAKKNLAPGESTKLNVKYNTKQRPGKFVKGITIFSDDPAGPAREVTITGNVLQAPAPKIWVPTVIQLGAVKPGAKLVIDFPVENRGVLELEVRKISRMKYDGKNHPSGADPLMTEPFRLSPKGDRKFSYDVTAPATPGYFRFVYSVESSDPIAPSVYVTCVGRVD